MTPNKENYKLIPLRELFGSESYGRRFNIWMVRIEILGLKSQILEIQPPQMFTPWEFIVPSS